MLFIANKGLIDVRSDKNKALTLFKTFLTNVFKEIVYTDVIVHIFREGGCQTFEVDFLTFVAS